MSGILGIFEPFSLTHPQVLASMQEAVRHRGPDGVGLWHQGAVSIGHQLLATTPESRFERSPWIDADSFVITADVRLDNREDLITQLDLPHLGQSEAHWTDPDLILRAYRRWGHDCPKHLLGAFAFVIWDPHQKTLFGARDHLGVKPFYYFHQPDYFAFASEIKALLKSPQISGDLDPIRIGDLLTSHLNDPVRTSFQGILRLPAAHQFERSQDGSFSLCQYWELDSTYELSLESDAHYISAFQDIFTEAVRCRLRSSGPIGSHLSGGMDSSSVTCTAQKLLAHQCDRRLHTFSATFAGVPECDESYFIQKILASADYQAHFVAADESGPLTYWETIFSVLDESALGNGYLTWLINRSAHQQGVNVVLNGYDGDTTIGHGVLFPQELARRGLWKESLQESQLLAQRSQIEGFTALTSMRQTAHAVLVEFRRQRQWWKILKAIPQLVHPLKLNPVLLWINFFLKPFAHSLKQSFFPWFRKPLSNLGGHPSKLIQWQQRYSFLSPSFVTRYGEAILKHQQCFELLADQPKTVRSQQWQTITSGIMTFPMELLDLISAVFQIEPRYPFMDKRLVEFCLALPSEFKLRHGWTRYILRQSMEDILPSEVQWRETKTNLSKAFGQGLRQYDQSVLEDIFLENPHRFSAFVDVNEMQRRYRNLQDQNSFINDLWPAITLSLWLKKRQPID